MKSFRYVARDLSGNRKDGVKQAGNSNNILNWLRDEGLTPVSVTEVSAGAAGASGSKKSGSKSGSKSSSSSKKTKSSSNRKRIKSADLSALCWQLTTMVEGGIPITGALETIAEDVENLQLQTVLQQVLEKMHKGETFSGSLAQFPKIFNQLACAIILAGETGGNLPKSLHRLAEYFDNRDKLARKVQGAMAYPAFVLFFIVAIVVFIMAFIIPRFTIIFDQMKGDLPGFTKGFMGFYNVVRDNVVYIIVGVVLLIVACIVINKTKKGHYFFSRFALAFPLLGKVLSQAFVTVFCKTMSTLIAAGVSVLEIFDILLVMTNNDVIKDAIIQTRAQIVEGANISSSLSTSGFFPNMVVKMIQVGEESGSLSTVLDRTAAYYERKVDSMINTLMSLLEPIMIVTVGGIVLVVVLALYLPIFSMSG